MDKDLARDLAEVVNRHSRENLSNTPDFLLAEFMLAALEAAELFTAKRDRWYGIAPKPGWQRPAVDDLTANAVAYRLAEQREALISACEIFRMIHGDDKGEEPQNVVIERWMDRFGKLADPPLVVEVEEDDDTDDEPTTKEPGAGESSGRWRPLSSEGPDLVGLGRLCSIWPHAPHHDCPGVPQTPAEREEYDRINAEREQAPDA
jgi:hypothetical protein